MICGLWFVTRNGTDAVKIDLSPGLGQWRVQQLNPWEFIIGMHSYIVADDESVESYGQDFKPLTAEPQEDSAWLDSIGFILYKFKPFPIIPTGKPRGRPRKLPINVNYCYSNFNKV